MKKALIALAAAAAISPAAFAGDVSWGGDANVEGYMVRTQDDASGTTVSDDRGYTNRIRLKGTFKTDGNVSVNTRIILNDSSWTGDEGIRPGIDTPDTNQVKGVYSNAENDAVAVDYGYIQAPIAGWTFRFGRQIANWANCFLTCDDRRDRILAMKRFGGTTVILLNDKRQSTSDNEMIATAEGDLYVAAAVGVVKGWQWGLLLGKWIGEPGYALDEVYSVSPFVKGKVGSVKLQGAINILGGGDEDSGAFFNDTAISAYIRAGMEVGSVMLEGQAVIVQDGGLVAAGFDTFTMLVNNSPDNNKSNTEFTNQGFAALAALGGLGNSGANKFFADDQWMLGFRASGKMGKFGWKAAVTYLDTADTVDNATTTEYNLTTLDGGITYQVAKTTELYLNAAIGSFDESEDAGDEDGDIQAATVGITTTF